MPKKADSPVSDRDAMLNEIRQGKKLRNKEESDKRLEKQAAKKLASNGDQQQQSSQGDSVSVSPPPPPPPLLPPAPSSNGTPLSKKADSPVSDRDAMLNEIRQGKKLMSKGKHDKWLKKQIAERFGGDEKERDKWLDELAKKNQKNSFFDGVMRHTLLERKKGISPSSDSNSSSSSDSNGWSSNEDEEQNKQSFASAQADASIEADYETDFDEELRNCKNEPSNFQPDNERESPDSGYEDNAGFRPISPVHPEQKTEESPVLPDSRVNSPSAVQVNNVNLVDNKVQDPSTSSIKDRRKFFDSIGGVPNFSK